jgi:hypothetical protein
MAKKEKGKLTFRDSQIKKTQMVYHAPVEISKRDETGTFYQNQRYVFGLLAGK